MAGGTDEATLEAWASSLREVKGRIRPLFQQKRMAASASLFLDALLGPERRKTGWMRAEAAGAPGPRRRRGPPGRRRGGAGRAPEPRAPGGMRGDAAGDPGPWRQQALLGRAQWDAEALRDVVRDYVVAAPGGLGAGRARGGAG